MYIAPPISKEMYLAAAKPAFERPENALMVRPKPRASGLAGDAREIAYMMAGKEEDTWEESRGAGARYELDGTVTQEQGRLMEDLSVTILSQAGIGVTDRQAVVNDLLPYTGHPDGLLFPIENLNEHVYSGVNNSGETEWVNPEMLHFDGLVWGFEHKHLGRYQYEQIMKKGLMEAVPEYILQATLYGNAFEWDAVMFVILAQDASSVRGDMTSNRRSRPENRWVDKHEWQHPKVMTFGIDLRPLYETLLPMALPRAQWFVDWAKNDGDPRNVRMEHDPYPDDKGVVGFPWAWSEWLALAQSDGQQGKQAPPLPFTGTWDM